TRAFSVWGSGELSRGTNASCLVGSRANNPDPVEPTTGVGVAVGVAVGFLLPPHVGHGSHAATTMMAADAAPIGTSHFQIPEIIYLLPADSPLLRRKLQ